MTIDVTVLTIFVAGPDNVSEEKGIVGQVADELNDINRDDYHVRFEVIKWPDNITPDFADYSQQVIGKQIEGKYDIWIGIVWTTYGTPTVRAGSGTEEELENALQSWREGNLVVAPRMYFKDEPLDRFSAVDPEEAAKILALKRRVASLGGLYKEFLERKEFIRSVRMDLNGIARRYKQRSQTARSTKRQAEFWSLLSRADEAHHHVRDILGRLRVQSAKVKGVVDENRALFDELHQLGWSARRKAVILFQRVASAVSAYSKLADEMLEPLEQHIDTMLDAWSQAVTIWSEEFDASETGLLRGLHAAEEFEETLRVTRNQLIDLRIGVAHVPPLSINMLSAQLEDRRVLIRVKRGLGVGEREARRTVEAFRTIVERNSEAEPPSGKQ